MHCRSLRLAETVQLRHNSADGHPQSQPMKSSADTAWIVERARSLGFALCGVVHAEKFPELERTAEWLARGYAGEMHYLNDPRRADPRTAMPGVRSIIVCALNYNSPAPRSVEALHADAAEPRGWISRYAWGRDYHDVLQQKLRILAAALHERFTEPCEARIYCDTGPLNERVLAKHAGLGWLGKNTLLLNAKLGSWFFLGVLLTTLDLSPSLGAVELPPPDLCGSCSKCIDACPTDALVQPYLMDARLCISYLTIELRGSIPENLREPMGRHVFGCDICQDVCPWNRRAPATTAEEFQPRAFSNDRGLAADAGERHQAEGALRAASGQTSPSPASDEAKEFRSGESFAEEEKESLFLPRLAWLVSLSEEQFRSCFRGSAMKRTKWRGLIRNACIALGNSPLAMDSAQQREIRAILTQLSSSAEPAIAESAQWVLSRIESA